MEEKHSSDQFQIQIQESAKNKNNAQQKNDKQEKAPEDGKRQIAHGTSDFGAFLHIVKSSLGSGILVMPLAFKHAGLLMGLIGCIIVGVVVTHTNAILINCSQSLCIIFNKKYLSYGDTAWHAFAYGYKGRLKRYAGIARAAVNFFLFITYYGVNISYVLLLAETSKQILEHYFDFQMNIRIYTSLMLLLVYPVGIIKLMKYLVPFSMTANFLLLVSLCLVFREIFIDLPDIDSRSMVQSFNDWPIFISMVFLSLEGIGTIMPIENEMKYPKRLTHSPGLLYCGMMVVVVFNSLIGFFGYLKYGDDCKGSVSLNLPNDWLSETVKFTIALSLLLTYGLQLTVSVKAVWDNISRCFTSNSKLYYLGIRSLLILGTVLIATALPSLSGVISLLGAIGFSILGIFLPALIELVFLSDTEGCFHWTFFIKNVLLMVVALFCGIVGTYCSIIELIGNIH